MGFPATGFVTLQHHYYQLRFRLVCKDLDFCIISLYQDEANEGV